MTLKVADLMQKSLKWTRKEKIRQLTEAKAHIAEFGGPIPNTTTQQQQQLVDVPNTVTDLKDLFHTFDPDENGYIDATEFADAMAFLGHPFANEKQAKRAFERLDKKKTGRVTEKDFVNWWHDNSNDELRIKLGEKYKFTGTGKQSRGIVFG